jgi:hypothetical protein
VTLLLWWIARKQLGGISNTAKKEFIKKFNGDFFNDTTRSIIMLFNYNALSFNSVEIDIGKGELTEPFPYFTINENIIRQLKISPEEHKFLIDKKFFTAFEIDDFLLGYFEDIGSYEMNGMIDIRDVYNSFDWYIDMIWNNEEIKKYVNSLLDEKDGGDIYEDFKYIYEKCDSYGEAKLSGKSMLWWHYKWIFHKRLHR